MGKRLHSSLILRQGSHKTKRQIGVHHAWCFFLYRAYWIRPTPYAIMPWCVSYLFLLYPSCRRLYSGAKNFFTDIGCLPNAVKQKGQQVRKAAPQQEIPQRDLPHDMKRKAGIIPYRQAKKQVEHCTEQKFHRADQSPADQRAHRPRKRGKQAVQKQQQHRASTACQGH